MTISRSDLRKILDYEALSWTAITPSEPDSVCFQIGTVDDEELVEVECLSSGLKTVYCWQGPGQRLAVDLASAEFENWSGGLKRKAAEALVELSTWESAMRRPGGAWDALEPANFAPLPQG